MTEKESQVHLSEMLMAIAMWLCALPFIGLLVIPVWGSTTASLLALALLAAILLLCWGSCGWKLLGRR
jgi:uncharacterized membrane protein YqjE